jgi:hypothetical protein
VGNLHGTAAVTSRFSRRATGGFSRRQIERATDDSLAFRIIAANAHPDHATHATFRKRFAQTFAAVLVQVLQVARENPLSRFGTVSLDGTKIHANATARCRLGMPTIAQRTEGRGPGTPGPRPHDPINLTAEESRLLPVAGGGVEPCDHAPARVDTETLLVLIAQVTYDKPPIAPMLE